MAMCTGMVWLLFVGCGEGSDVPPADADDSGSGADTSDPVGSNASQPTRETCNGLDDDGDGEVDENAEDEVRYGLDGDGDGYAPYGWTGCPPPEAVFLFSDCDDANPEAHPGAVEACNAFDDDCDGVTDPLDSVGCSATYADEDADGLGGAEVCGCAGAAGIAQEGGDCDDASANFGSVCGSALMVSFSPFLEVLELPANLSASGDLDGDGLLDISSAGGLLLVPEAGMVLAADITVATESDSGNTVDKLRDLDGDGLADLATVSVVDSDCFYDNLDEWCRRAETVNVYQSPLLGVLSPSWTGDGVGYWFSDIYGASPTYLFPVGDVDSDGDAELLYAAGAGGVPVWYSPSYLLHGEGEDEVDVTLAPEWPGGSSGGNVIPMVSADVNRDGIVDFISDSTVYLGPLGAELPAELGRLSAMGYVEGTADLDGDGVAELLYVDSTGISVAPLPVGDVLLSDSELGRFVEPADASAMFLRGSGDLDGDGDDEIVLTVAYDTGEYAVVVWSGPLLGEHDPAEAATVWRFDASLRVSFALVDEGRGSVAVFWTLEADTAATTGTLSFLPY